MLEEYAMTLNAVGAMAALMIVQVLVSDVVGIRLRHIPGTPINADHNYSHFRVSRVVANTNETIAVFVLLLVFCLLGGADPAYTGYCAWSFVAARLVYAFCYYGNVQMLRSVAFGVSLLALLAMLVTGFVS